MKSTAMQEIVVVVVNKAVANAKELVEALFLWPKIPMSPKVPFSEERGSITCRLQCLSQRHFLKRHVDTVRPIHVALRPVMDTTPLRMPSRHQRRPRRATNRVSIRLSESHSSGCKSVDIGSPEVG